jgi:hypothetical protein
MQVGRKVNQAVMLDRWHQHLHGTKMAKMSGSLLKARSASTAFCRLPICKRLFNKDALFLMNVTARDACQRSEIFGNTLSD